MRRSFRILFCFSALVLAGLYNNCSPRIAPSSKLSSQPQTLASQNYQSPLVYLANSPGMYHQAGAAKGTGWVSRNGEATGVHLSYGPYQSLPNAGDYVAMFQLAIDDTGVDSLPVASIEVFNSTRQQILFTQDLYRSDFSAASTPQDFIAPFIAQNSTDIFEYRVFLKSAVALEHLSTVINQVAGAGLQLSVPVSARDFLIQKVCVSPEGVTQKTDPYFCSAPNTLRSLNVDEALPYHKHEWYSIVQSDSYPVLDPQGQELVVSSLTSLRRAEQGKPAHQFDVPSDAFDIYTIQEGWASASQTRDPGGFGTSFWSQGCKPYNGWPFFPTSLLAGGSLPVAQTSGETAPFIAGKYWEQDGVAFGSCPPASLFANVYSTDWSFHPLYALGGDPSVAGGAATKYLPTIVAVNGYNPTSDFLGNGHLEIFYFTQLYGRTRWEAWWPAVQGKSLMPTTGGCIGPTQMIYKGIKFVKQTCIDVSLIDGTQPTMTADPIPVPDLNILENWHFTGPSSIVTYLGNDPALKHQTGVVDGSGFSTNVSLPATAFLTYGPYADQFAAGSYVARFNLDVDNNSNDNVAIAHIDVVEDSSVVLASQEITRRQMSAPGTGTAFDLAFQYMGGGKLEFRVYYYGSTYLKHISTEIIPQAVYRAGATALYRWNRAGTAVDTGSLMNWLPKQSTAPLDMRTHQIGELNT